MSDLNLDPPVVRMPALRGTQWLQTTAPLERSQLRGRVVLIDFWEYSCVNCVRTFPYLRTWHERYSKLGLQIIGVHTPEFKFGADPEQIEAAAQRHGLDYPLLLDNDNRVWTEFANRAWPTKYLIDAKGYIRLKQQGEGNYGRVERAIQELLREVNPGLELPPPLEPLRPEDVAGAVCYRTTPELYAGHATAGFFHTPGLGNPPQFLTESPLMFDWPEQMDEDRFYLSGFWRIGAEEISFAGQEAGRLRLRYRAVGVNAVLSWSPDPIALRLGLTPAGYPPTVELRHAGQPLDPVDAGADVQYDAQGRSIMVVDRPRMYELVRHPDFQQRDLEIHVSAIGLALYTFTFTSCVIGGTVESA